MRRRGEEWQGQGRWRWRGRIVSSPGLLSRHKNNQLHSMNPGTLWSQAFVSPSDIASVPFHLHFYLFSFSFCFLKRRHVALYRAHIFLPANRFPSCKKNRSYIFFLVFFSSHLKTKKLMRKGMRCYLVDPVMGFKFRTRKHTARFYHWSFLKLSFTTNHRPFQRFYTLSQLVIIFGQVAVWLILKMNQFFQSSSLY